MKNNILNEDVTGANFRCLDCAKEWQDYRTARSKAYRHALLTGHKVSGEITSSITYHFPKPIV